MLGYLGIKTDYSLLESLIKVPSLINYALKNNLNYLGIVDNNLSYVMEFYDLCIKNNIKPIIGLDVIINNKHIYLYPYDYEGYLSLLKINTLNEKKELNPSSLKLNNYHLFLVLPYNSYDLYDEYKDIFTTYLSYENDYEKQNALILCENIIYQNIIRAFTLEDLKYLNILEKISEKEILLKDNAYFINKEDNNISFINKINIVIPKNKRYIPIFDKNKDSFNLLSSLVKKGLEKRLNNNVPLEYQKRSLYELNVIKNMGYVDYFLIVYDYVKYAKTHNIMVGPGRGSAASSLVSYAIGITNIDPLKYNLLFERFLNPDRITMPDIDIDFEDIKREEIISYVKERYGHENVAPIMTYGTLGSRQVLKDVAKALLQEKNIDYLTKIIDQKLPLSDNLKDIKVQQILKLHPELKDIYNIALKLEGLKRHISTHAAGVVICSVPLDDVIPITINDGNILTGLTMSYLEELGLLKMDFLALSNLTIIHEILNLIPKKIDINNIPIDDSLVYQLLSKGDTVGVFQFESSGMINFLKKLKPKTYSDLYAALALFRPGPMGNIDTFIRRKNGYEKVYYPVKELEPILKETYGIMVYQEQIMQVLVTLAGYTFAEADNIRRAMSKKKEDIIVKEKDYFINKVVNKGYPQNIALKIYDDILKFANYGFNKAHSVSYAMIGYQMAYLKVHYPSYFIANLLNMNIGNSLKTNDYLNLAKEYNLYLLKPDVNLSNKDYKIAPNKLRLPLGIIKQVGLLAANEIINIRKDEPFKDFIDFILRTSNTSINKKVITYLVYAGAFDSFKVNHHTLIANLDNLLRYASLRKDFTDSLVESPILEEYEEYSSKELMEQEFMAYGFYISNHPASRYNTKEYMKLNKISNFFNKFIKSVVIIDNIHQIKTKKGDKMAFIKASDETGTTELVVFPKSMALLNDVKENSLVMIDGVIAKRLDQYQINVNNIKVVEGESNE